MDIIVSGIILLVLDIDGDNIMYLIISLVGLFKLSGDGFSVLINGLVIDFELQNFYLLIIQVEVVGKYGNGLCCNKNFNFDLEEFGCSVLVLCVIGLDKNMFFYVFICRKQNKENIYDDK